MNIWDCEPNYLAFEACGLLCEVKRTPRLGNWCGYVEVPYGHPAYGKHYMDDRICDIDVHGGLTYSEGGKFGFDCAHAFDFCPEIAKRLGEIEGSKDPMYGSYEKYRTMGFVIDETIKLAIALKKMSDENED